MGDDRDIATVVAELLASGAIDWVSTHDVLWLSTKGDRDTAAKQRVMRVFDHLFHESLMVPGDLGESGFEDWQGSAADWLPRAQAELDQLDWQPMGAGFWLRSADDGRTPAT